MKNIPGDRRGRVCKLVSLPSVDYRWRRKENERDGGIEGVFMESEGSIRSLQKEGGWFV